MEDSCCFREDFGKIWLPDDGRKEGGHVDQAFVRPRHGNYGHACNGEYARVPARGMESREVSGRIAVGLL
jgi:hypothetical protein